MKNNYAFIALSDNITSIITLPSEVKDKKNPFIIVNTDDDHGLYVKKLEKEFAKYKGLEIADGETGLHGIETGNLIVFGDSRKFDYRIEMNYVTLASLTGKDVKVYDIINDYDKIVRRLATYCKNNGIKRKANYRNDCLVDLKVTLIEEKPTKKVCPLLNNVLGRNLKLYTPKVEKTLVNIYSKQKPDVTVEQVTVHSDWVKIGWNQYDIYVDMLGNELITLEDGERLYVKTDRFGRRYLAS
jgi:hypothetical protein